MHSEDRQCKARQSCDWLSSHRLPRCCFSGCKRTDKRFQLQLSAGQTEHSVCIHCAPVVTMEKAAQRLVRQRCCPIDLLWRHVLRAWRVAGRPPTDGGGLQLSLRSALQHRKE